MRVVMNVGLPLHCKTQNIKKTFNSIVKTTHRPETMGWKPVKGSYFSVKVY